MSHSKYSFYVVFLLYPCFRVYIIQSSRIVSINMLIHMYGLFRDLEVCVALLRQPLKCIKNNGFHLGGNLSVYPIAMQTVPDGTKCG